MCAENVSLQKKYNHNNITMVGLYYMFKNSGKNFFILFSKKKKNECMCVKDWLLSFARTFLFLLKGSMHQKKLFI